MRVKNEANVKIMNLVEKFMCENYVQARAI